MHPFLDTSLKQFVTHVASVECSREGVFVGNQDICIACNRNWMSLWIVMDIVEVLERGLVCTPLDEP